jgi:putative serine protease PepD
MTNPERRERPRGIPQPGDIPGWMQRSLDERGPSQPEPGSQPSSKDARSGRRIAVALACGLALLAGFVGARWLDDDPRTTTTEDVSMPSIPPPIRGSASEPAAAVARALTPSVVQIETGAGLGSGVIYDPDGLILTAAHVVDGAGGEVTVRLANGTRLAGEVVGTDDRTDVAVVRVEGSGLTPASLAVGKTLRVGQTAVAIGSPFGLEGSVTAGIVSAIDRSVTVDGGFSVSMIQTDAPINPGNSGGALADGRGRVIGINDAIRSDSGVNSGVGFAIPIDTAAAVAEALVNGEEPAIGFLGVSGTEPTSGPGGALVLEVVPGSPAATSDIEPGDLVTALDGDAVESMSDLGARIRAIAPGTEVTLTVERDGRTMEISVTLGNG